MDPDDYTEENDFWDYDDLRSDAEYDFEDLPDGMTHEEDEDS